MNNLRFSLSNGLQSLHKHYIKISGILLIICGLSVLTLRITGQLTPAIQGALQVVLILGLPALGAFLLFASRYLTRLPGIDNDHIYQRSISAKGLIAWLLGLVLTFFYVVIYLGNDFQMTKKQGTFTIDSQGFISESKGELTYDNGSNLIISNTYTAILPNEEHLQQKISDVLTTLNASSTQIEKLQKPITLSFGHTYHYKALLQPQFADGKLIVQLEKIDTLHHFFTRHIYSLFDSLAYWLTGHSANNWFFYGTLYTFAVLVFGFRMLMKYRHNRYQILRTCSVMFFQLGFAYILPNLLKLFHQPEFYFSYFWPLKPEYFYPQTWEQTYGAGVYFLAIGVFMSFVATPILTYSFGKRWYCSWVCGCGGLAETMGDPFRQLSSKSLLSWKIERWFVLSVLGAIILVTALLWINSLGAGSIFGHYSYSLQKAYGFFIGAIFSGVIGVGFYPLLGTRVWCRFGCPMAAILGLLQKWFSRFRITTNGGQCISCGNCSTYCEMGIDVRWYAQRGQNIIRASCVGCGICAAVCPRGVLRLENKSPQGSRYNGPNPSVLGLSKEAGLIFTGNPAKAS